MRRRVRRAGGDGRVPFRRPGARGRSVPDGPVWRAGQAGRGVGRRMRWPRAVVGPVLPPARGRVPHQQGDGGRSGVRLG